jgi:hypothetical protein
MADDLEPAALLIEGELYMRTRWGSEQDDELKAHGLFDGPCTDCGCALGELHTMGCDMERCPRCNRQLFSCCKVDDV